MPSKRALASVEPDQDPVDVLSFPASPASTSTSNWRSSSLTSTPSYSASTLATPRTRNTSFFSSLKASISQTFSPRPNKKRRTGLPEPMKNNPPNQDDQSNPTNPTNPSTSTSSSDSLYPALSQHSLYPSIPQIETQSKQDGQLAVHSASLPSSSNPPPDQSHQATTSDQEQRDAEEVADELSLEIPQSQSQSQSQSSGIDLDLDPHPDHSSIDQSPTKKATGARKRRSRSKKKGKGKQKQSESNHDTQEAVEEEDEQVEERLEEGKEEEPREAENYHGKLQQQMDSIRPKLGRSALPSFLEDSALADASTIAIAPRSEDGDESRERDEAELEEQLESFITTELTEVADPPAPEPEAEVTEKDREEEAVTLNHGSFDEANVEPKVAQEQSEVGSKSGCIKEAPALSGNHSLPSDEDLIDSEDLILQPIRSASTSSALGPEEEEEEEGRHDDDDNEQNQDQLINVKDQSVDLRRERSLDPAIDEDNEVSDSDGENRQAKASEEVRADADEPLEEEEDDEEIFIPRRSDPLAPEAGQEDDASHQVQDDAERKVSSSRSNGMAYAMDDTEEGEEKEEEEKEKGNNRQEEQEQEPEQRQDQKKEEQNQDQEEEEENEEDEEDEERLLIGEDKENEPPLPEKKSSVIPNGVPVVDLTGSDDEQEKDQDSRMDLDYVAEQDSSVLHIPTSAHLVPPTGRLASDLTSEIGNLSLSRVESRVGHGSFSNSSAIYTGTSRAPSIAPSSSAASFGKKPMFKKRDPIGWNDHKKKVQSHNTSKKLEKVKQAYKVWKTALGPKSKTMTNFADFQSMVQLGARASKAIAQGSKKGGKAAQIDTDEFYTNNYLERIFLKEQRSSKSVLPTPQYKLDEFQRLEKERRLRAKKARGVLGRRPLPFTLKEEQEEEVRDVFKRRGKVSTIPGAEVTDSDIAKLKPRTWLNDEVINFYGIMILARANKAEAARKEAQQAGKKWDRSLNAYWRVHYFSSFFYSKLYDHGYQSVRRWSKKVDLFTRDIVLVPINVGGAHWVCAAINLRKKRFEYYDSLQNPNKEVFKTLRSYLIEEAKDKKKGDLDLSDWTDYFNPQNPQQQNGYDCGVFSSVTLEQISRRDPFTTIPDALKWDDAAGTITGWQDSVEDEDEDAEELQSGERDWNFSQEHMPYLRRRMVYEIATKNLLE